LVSYLTNLQQFTLSIAKGDLSQTLKLQGSAAGSLKSLQASLRHLTWQTQMIAQGDFSQRVDFMGEFSTAFNTMVADLEKMTSELHHSNAELEARNEELDAFAHTLAHDLKSPIAVLAGYSQLLAANYDRLTEKMLQESALTIARQSYKLANIVDNILMLASTRQAQVDVSPLNMALIVAEARQRCLQLVEEYQAEISAPGVDTWPQALGYGPWIEEVWTNYLSNAIKYGGQPPRVELGADSLRGGGGMVRFWARDNGVGISPQDQARLFAPFERLGQVRVKGHGLGLSIVRRIVEKLGGQVGVESAGVPGQGSVFFFTLPGIVGNTNSKS
jgi:two-component system sensor histidine kinase/response regulator